MQKNREKELLKDRRVIEEIKRHLWIESEKAGYDIGFDRAAEQWLKNFSKAWMEYHMPGQKAKTKPSVSSRKTAGKQRRPRRSSARK